MVAWDRNKVVDSKSNLEGAELKGMDLSGLDSIQTKSVISILGSQPWKAKPG